MTGEPGDGARRVVVRAPVRVGDVGGWTDTWFGSPGVVCHLAVGPAVVVEAAFVDGVAGPGLGPVRIVAPLLFEDYRAGPSPDRGWRWPVPGRQPLLEHAVASVLEDVPLPAGRSVELHITSAVPAGASLGTSGSVVVAVLAALDALVGRRRSAAELATAAHAVETDRARRESGVQDQWAAALGGCGLLAIGPYPDVRHRSVALADDTVAELGERLVTVVFGPHDSSAVHAQVIDAMVGYGGPTHDAARSALGRLSALAPEAAAALEGGSVDDWARVLTAATDAQGALHPDLVGAAHAAAIDVARSAGANGWKVNGAGGEGGSLTVVAPDAAAAADLSVRLAHVSPAWQVVDLRPAGPLEVLAVTP
ncbi:hypothetical protein KSP35_05855 [Aquihabitans sp. G128]|uniref:GHMP family kinase ATP-binding protein n=1 Tax=Aquihabitans sp. G128 TaxID=2849779 RepID=UPI001C211072|nr:hypothetical protein [Aquihabitans sp. G128]QXC62329.1 hypothetical protein KSP35_05855 [Aquihabitans sp. G128]